MIESFFNQLFQTDKPRTEGELWYFKFFELFVGAYVIKYAWEWAAYIPRNSDVVLPLGIANYIDISFMFGDVWPVVNAIFITLLCILCFFRIQFRWQYFLVLVLLHFQFAARYSQGEIPHSMNMIGMSLLALALATFLFKKPWEVSRFTFGSVYFFVGLSYFSAAISKLIGTGLYWFDGRHLWLWIAEKGIDILSRTGTFEPNFLQEMALQSLPVASVILLIGWLTEFAGVFVWSNKYRSYAITAIIAMHIGITLSMNIRFDAYVLELLIIGYPWNKLLDKYRSRLPAFQRLSALSRS
jgi:hypothetical protein